MPGRAAAHPTTIVRQARLDAGPFGGLAGGSIAYAAGTVATALGLVIPSLRRNVVKVSSENARTLQRAYGGCAVAMPQIGSERQFGDASVIG